jgi:iron complex outermembrane receptor protein
MSFARCHPRHDRNEIAEQDMFLLRRDFVRGGSVMTKMKKLALLLTTAAIGHSEYAFAQDKTPLALEEIVVTARQRSEKLMEIPLSITSLSADQIEQAQIRDMTELTKFTPGFNFKNQNTQTGARVLPSYRFRGMNAGVGGSLSQLGAVFIDGLYLLGGAQALTFDDIERIEVIKGPQSAYFGRSTFGGAVNFITRQPGNDFSGRAALSVETRDSRSASLSFEGPVIEDRLFFRVSGTSNQMGAHYKTSDGGELGRQRTDSGSVQLIAKPNDNLEIRAHYLRSEGDDSSPAIVDLNASRPDIQGNPAECTRGTLPFWCGQLPKLGDVGVPSSIIDTTTNFVTPAFARSNSPNIISDILNNNQANPLSRTDFALHDRLPNIDHMGLESEFDRYALSVDYDFADGYTFHVAGQDSTSRLISVSSLLKDGASVFIIPAVFENKEGEVRVSSPENEKFTWLAGANVFEQKELGSPAAGNGVRVDAANNVVYSAPQFYGSQGKVSYWGVFGGLHYEIVDKLSLDVEGRYQRDRVTNSFDSPSAQSATFKAFAPRVILSYKGFEGTTLYASWSRGVNPGFVNSQTALLSTALQTQVRADPGYVDRVGKETLDNYEIGIKQQLDFMRYSVSAYYADWKNLKNQIFYFCPGLQCGPGFFAPLVGIFTARSGTLKGIEGEFNVAVTDELSADLTFEVIDSQFDSFSSPTAAAATGRTSGTDLKVFEYPVASGAFASTYRAPLVENYDWYVRAEVTYTGKTYTDEFNQSWVGDYFTANARIGISGDGKRLEIYGTNLFNQDQWVAGRRGSTQLDPRPAFATQYPTAFLTPARKQAFGVRASYEF